MGLSGAMKLDEATNLMKEILSKLKIGSDESFLKIVDSHVTVGPGNYTLVVKSSILKKRDIEKIVSIAKNHDLSIFNLEGWFVIYRPHYEFLNEHLKFDISVRTKKGVEEDYSL